MLTAVERAPTSHGPLDLTQGRNYSKSLIVSSVASLKPSQRVLVNIVKKNLSDP